MIGASSDNHRDDTVTSLADARQAYWKRKNRKGFNFLERLEDENSGDEFAVK